MKTSMRVFAVLFSASVTTVLAGACGGSNTGSGFVQNDASSGGSSGGGGHGNGGMDGSTLIDDDASYGSLGDATKGGQPPPASDAGHGCTNLQCDVASCGDGGAPTTLTGRVLDPAGHNPLYNVVVFVPNTMGGTLPLIPRGVNTSSCSCGQLFEGEEPIVDTLTLADGTFTLKGVPSGKNIPLVVQIGKWRKEIVVPQVTSCQSTAAGDIPMPKNGSDGLFASMPNIAVSTGAADSLECLLTRIGIDESEFSGDPNTPAAHVHIFSGIGGNKTQNPTSGAPAVAGGLWDSDADIERYDITMLSCEGMPTAGANPQVVADYVNLGGRVFAEHFHYAFFANQPQFPNTANWSVGGSYPGAITGSVQTTLLNGNMFPEGQALETWLTNVGALTNNLLPITVARDDATVVASNVSTPWIVTGPGVSPAGTQYFSWDMPFMPPVSEAGIPEYCGRVVFSDLHVSGGDGPGQGEDYNTSSIVPTGCASTVNLQPDEDALEFIFFDLASCVTPIGFPPQPPPANPPEGGTIQ